MLENDLTEQAEITQPSPCSARDKPFSTTETKGSTSLKARSHALSASYHLSILPLIMIWLRASKSD